MLWNRRGRRTSPCARLQHKARDGDHRRGWAAGGLGYLSQGLAHSNGRQQTAWGAPRAPGDGFQEEYVQPGKLPAVRSERGADISFFTQPGPKGEVGITQARLLRQIRWDAESPGPSCSVADLMSRQPRNNLSSSK